MDTFWSTFVQTSEELYRSRALRFHKGNRDVWLQAIGLRDDTDVLEIGCGGGIFCHRVKQFLPGCRVTGLDFDSGHIAYARQKTAELGLDCAFVNGDALALPFSDNSFDLCFSHTVMEHIPTQPFLAEQLRVLRPGGRIAALSVRMKYSLPEFTQAGACDEEQALWQRLWDAVKQNHTPDRKVAAYELSEDGYPRALEEAGFRDVNVNFFAATIYAPDNVTTPREQALEQIDCDRHSCLLGINKSLALAPRAITAGEAARLRQLITARFDQRLADYEHGKKRWDICARMVLCATGTK